MSKHSCTVCVTVFSTGGKFAQFRILRSYMILLKSPVLMCSWAPLNDWTTEGPRTLQYCNHIMWTWYNCSLISRPSHHPVFDLLLYTKTEGEGLVHFITWITSVSTERGRGPQMNEQATCRPSLETWSWSFCSKWWSFECLQSKKLIKLKQKNASFQSISDSSPLLPT